MRNGGTSLVQFANTTPAEELDAAKKISDALLMAADLKLASEGIDNYSVGTARERLMRHIPGPGEPDRRNFAWHNISNALCPEIRKIEAGAPARDVQYSPDGRLFAVACVQGESLSGLLTRLDVAGLTQRVANRFCRRPKTPLETKCRLQLRQCRIDQFGVKLVVSPVRYIA